MGVPARPGSGVSEVALAVVGLGFGANHARVLSQIEGVRLAAVCDTDATRLATAAAATGATPYADLGAMLTGERLDGVVVAVPASGHLPVALSAIQAGCAVLIEKPLAPSLAEGRALVEAAQRAGVPLMAGHIERFNPAIQALVRRVRGGDIGRVLQLSARRTGAIRLPPRDVNVVHDSALHDIDTMRFVLGREVEEVHARTLAGFVAPGDNSLLATLRFQPSQGVTPLGALEVSWLSPRRLRDISVLGEDGIFVVDYAAQTLEWSRMPAARSGPVLGWEASRRADETEPVQIPVEPREQLVQELGAFVAALRGDCALPVTGDDALAALAVADALTESARTGRPVVPEQPWR